MRCSARSSTWSSRQLAAISTRSHGSSSCSAMRIASADALPARRRTTSAPSSTARAARAHAHAACARSSRRRSTRPTCCGLSAYAAMPFATATRFGPSTPASSTIVPSPRTRARTYGLANAQASPSRTGSIGGGGTTRRSLRGSTETAAARDARGDRERAVVLARARRRTPRRSPCPGCTSWNCARSTIRHALRRSSPSERRTVSGARTAMHHAASSSACASARSSAALRDLTSWCVVYVPRCVSRYSSPRCSGSALGAHVALEPVRRRASSRASRRPRARGRRRSRRRRRRRSRPRAPRRARARVASRLSLSSPS